MIHNPGHFVDFITDTRFPLVEDEASLSFQRAHGLAVKLNSSLWGQSICYLKLVCTGD